MTELYSHSRLSSFENCKKQFHFRYVLGLPQESEGIEAFVGKRVHEVLERLYQFVTQDQLPSLDKVVHRYHALWDRHFLPERVRIVKQGLEADHYRLLGEQCLRDYYRHAYPFDDDETLGIEERVEFALDADGRYRMQGIVDRIVRARDGAIEIHDYKTGGYVPSQKKLDVDRQLALYQIGLAEKYGKDRPVRLVWLYLQKRQRRTSVRTPEQLARLRDDTIALIDRVRDETDFTPTRSNLCSWCEYQRLCPLFGAAEDAGEQAAAAYAAARRRLPHSASDPPHSPSRALVDTPSPGATEKSERRTLEGRQLDLL